MSVFARNERLASKSTYLEARRQLAVGQIHALAMIRPSDAMIGGDAPSLVDVISGAGPNLQLVPVRGIAVGDICKRHRSIRGREEGGREESLPRHLLL